MPSVRYAESTLWQRNSIDIKCYLRNMILIKSRKCLSNLFLYNLIKISETKHTESTWHSLYDSVEFWFYIVHHFKIKILFISFSLMFATSRKIARVTFNNRLQYFMIAILCRNKLFMITIKGTYLM